MADMSTDLREQIEKLEELFVVPTAKLKEVVEQFKSELEKGLTHDGGDIVSRAVHIFVITIMIENLSP